MPAPSEELCDLLEALTGQPAPLSVGKQNISSFPIGGLGYSQLNELLLTLGYDRVTHEFFQFLADDTLEYQPGSSIPSIDSFRTGIDRARKLALLYFGNVKFGFKRLAKYVDELAVHHQVTEPLDPEMLKKRHEALQPVIPIDAAETYFMGYVVQQELKAALERDPNDKAAKEGTEKLNRIREAGTRNHQAYLVSDHLDVYVATSMRQRHEYIEIADIATRIFKEERIRDLKLRWFDPTQAYCPDRIDKGLAEGLMLKRAKCTLYLAQETDTLGKDSELASTLAQGKPVIAYVPSPTEADLRSSVKQLSTLYGLSENLVLLQRLQSFGPELAWKDSEVRKWLDAPAAMDIEIALQRLISVAQAHYRKRAEMLIESHPLGIQVHLETGVANGVLVARTVQACAELIYRIITRTLEFDIEEKEVDKVTYYLLREKISKSIFRVMTGDAMLTNAFWNFYLGAAEWNA
jgi:hypothetical protein